MIPQRLATILAFDVKGHDFTVEVNPQGNEGVSGTIWGPFKGPDFSEKSFESIEDALVEAGYIVGEWWAVDEWPGQWKIRATRRK